MTRGVATANLMPMHGIKKLDDFGVLSQSLAIFF